MAIHKLTPRFVETVKTKGMYGDGGGLYLQVGSGGGAKSWLFRYHVQGRGDRQMGLGPLHTIGLAEARVRARECRQMRFNGIDPINARNKDRIAKLLEATKDVTFAQCAKEYRERHEKEWAPRTAENVRYLIDRHLMPSLGKIPISMIDVNQVHTLLKPLYEVIPPTAERCRIHLEAIFNWATAKQYRIGNNPAAWKGPISTLVPHVSTIHKTKHYASLPFTEIRAFMVKLRTFRRSNRWGGHKAEPQMPALLLEFLILTAVRSHEAVGLRWEEIDFDRELWTCPAERTKTGKYTNMPHLVPLSGPAKAVLKAMQDMQKERKIESQLVFVHPGSVRPRPHEKWMVGKPASRTAAYHFLHKSMKRPDLTTHGFRSTFKAWSIEHGYDENVSEMQLDHVIGNNVRRIYARDAKLIEQRRLMMDAWAKYCASAEPLDAKIIPMGKAKRTVK